MYINIESQMQNWKGIGFKKHYFYLQQEMGCPKLTDTIQIY